MVKFIWEAQLECFQTFNFFWKQLVLAFFWLWKAVYIIDSRASILCKDYEYRFFKWKQTYRSFASIFSYVLFRKIQIFCCFSYGYEWALPDRLIDALARVNLSQKTLCSLVIIDIIFISKVNVVTGAHTLTGWTIRILLG